MTCDSEHDIPIIDDTMKIIYAYGENDPSPGIDSIMMHTRYTRGGKSIHLLGKSKTKDIELENDVEVMDLLVNNVSDLV